MTVVTIESPQSDISTALARYGPLGNNISVLADNICWYIEQGQTTAALALAELIRAQSCAAVCVTPNLVPLRPSTSTTD